MQWIKGLECCRMEKSGAQSWFTELERRVLNRVADKCTNMVDSQIHGSVEVPCTLHIMNGILMPADLAVVVDSPNEACNFFKRIHDWEANETCRWFNNTEGKNRQFTWIQRGSVMPSPVP